MLDANSAKFESGFSAACAVEGLDMGIVSMTWGADALSDDKDFIGVHILYGNESLERMRTRVSKVFGLVDCECGHDCCGCYFRQATTIMEHHKYGYVVLDIWKRNL